MVYSTQDALSKRGLRGRSVIFVWGSLAVLAGLGIGLWLGRQGSAGAVLAEKATTEALRAELAALRAEEGPLRERAARAEQAAADAARQLAEDQLRLDKLRAEIGAEAGRLLTEKSGELRAEAGRHFEGVVNPLRQNLDDLKALASRLSEQDARERNTLSEQVRRLAESHLAFSAKAEELSLSLKGNVKAQGKWGEVLLERVLELSGLAKGTQYVLQAEGMELKDEAGGPQKPDAVILLPDGKHLVIDAKAPLDGYFASLSAPDETTRSAAAQGLVKALRAQINGLAARKYPANEKLDSPEFTLMFVPIEAALGAALQQDPLLFEAAWDKRIVLVGPNMLFGTLKVIGQIWGQDKRNKNAEEIAKRGGMLYDKLEGFVRDFAKIKETVIEAQNKLSIGPGNVLQQAQKLKELGARTDKSLPPAWLEKSNEA